MTDDGIPERCDNDWSLKAAEIDRQVSKLSASVFPATPATGNAVHVDAVGFTNALSHLARIADHCRGLAETTRQIAADTGEG